MKIVIAGGSGTVGSALTSYFSEKGADVVVLSRSGKAPKGARAATWDGRSVGAWASELEGAEAVINLSGKSIASKWTDKNRQEIMASRVESTQTIGRAIQDAKNPPKTWINASAVGIYGDTGDQVATEATAPGEGFMAEVCKAWEAAVDEVGLAATRKVKTRFGVVFGPGAEAFEELNKIARLGLAAPLGSGRQWMSWVHLEDLCRCVEWCIREEITGAVNVTSPEPHTNAEIMDAFRRAHGRPPLPPVPSFMVKIVAGFKGVDPSTLLEGQRAYPEVAQARGFLFAHPNLDQTLLELTDAIPAAWSRAS